MLAYKVKGKIDAAGNLAIAEPVQMPAGDVEVIVLQAVEPPASSEEAAAEPQPASPKRQVPTKIRALKDWFAKTQPAPPDFDAEQARWEALKEKHNL